MKISARKILNKVATAAVVACTVQRIGMIATAEAQTESMTDLSLRMSMTGLSVLAMTATDDSMTVVQKKVLYAGCAALGVLSLITLALDVKTTVIFECIVGEPIIIGGEATM